MEAFNLNVRQPLTRRSMSLPVGGTNDPLVDSLTKLPNRLFLELKLQDLFSQSDPRFALVVLDINRFKMVNESFGHRVGDQLLQLVGQRLKKGVRSYDYVVRLSGDEFAVILTNLPHGDEAVAATKKILNVLSEPFWLFEKKFSISAGAGIALAVTDALEGTTLLANAENALYQAKKLRGQSFKCYNSQMAEKIQLDLLLSNELSAAIEGSQISIDYQPVYHTQTHQIVSFEALARWQHLDYGLVSPASFIPLAEDTGLILPLGYRVLKESFHQLKSWQENFDEDLKMSVNVSTRQFFQPKFTDHVKRLLAEAELYSTSVQLEITESLSADNSEVILPVLKNLKNLGVGISIDDFGTGFACLANLKNFPADTIKIDRSFLDECAPKSKNGAIVQAIIDMGHQLDLRVVAEGVETPQQLKLLESLGCDYIQGYLLAKPMSAGEIETSFFHH